MKLFKQRILPAIILIIVVAILIIPIAIFGEDYFEVRIFSYVAASLITSFLIYEFFSAFRMKWYHTTVMISLVLLALFLPIENVITFCSPKKSIYLTGRSEYITVLKNGLVSWETILIITITTISFFLIEMYSKINMSWADRFVRAFLVWFSLYFMINAMRFLQIALIFDWKIVLLLVLGPSVNDTAAFFGGRWFGRKIFKKNLAPNISPKKTFEGMAFGVIFCLALVSGLIFGLDMIEGNLAMQIVVTISMPFLAVAGDLYFSYLKRLNGVKDYSQILGGHGGMMDRFDSISFCTALFCIIYIFI